MRANVRAATPADAPAVRELARESWHAAYGGFLERERITETVEEWYAVADLEGSIEKARDRDDVLFLVAEEPSGEIVGFAHAGPRREDRSTGALYRIYAHPDVWGEGVGTTLLECVEGDLPEEFDRLWLAVLADNEVGVSFYESRGFERTETRESRFDGLEEYVYEKGL